MSSYTGQGTILGGLPVIADVDWGTSWDGEGYAEISQIYWLKRNGTKGKPIPKKLFDRAELYDSYFSSLIEQLSELCAYEQYEREREESGLPEMVQLFDADHPPPNQEGEIDAVL